MGVDKFSETCRSKGRELPDDVAALAVNTFRSVNAPVTTAWKMLEKAAIAAVENPGKKYTINRTSWWVKDGFLWCGLPSGRRLAYAEPSVRYEARRKTPAALLLRRRRI